MLIKVRKRGEPRNKPLGITAKRIWGPDRGQETAAPFYAHTKSTKVVVKLGQDFKQNCKWGECPEVAERYGSR